MGAYAQVVYNVTLFCEELEHPPILLPVGGPGANSPTG